MKECLNCCSVEYDDEDTCTSCGGNEFNCDILECVHCQCWVGSADMDRNQLCGGQGNDCQSDEDILEEYESANVSLILSAAAHILKDD